MKEYFAIASIAESDKAAELKMIAQKAVSFLNPPVYTMILLHYVPSL